MGIEDDEKKGEKINPISDARIGIEAQRDFKKKGCSNKVYL